MRNFSKFIEVTQDFPKLIAEDIENLMNDIQPYTTDTGFACPKSIDEDTFNTDAGAVKAILAPIVADFHTLGDVQVGYDIVNLIYKCVDKDKFIDTLKNVYNLK